MELKCQILIGDAYMRAACTPIRTLELGSTVPSPLGLNWLSDGTTEKRGSYGSIFWGRFRRLLREWWIYCRCFTCPSLGETPEPERGQSLGHKRRETVECLRSTRARLLPRGSELFKAT